MTQSDDKKLWNKVMTKIDAQSDDTQRWHIEMKQSNNTN